MTAPYEHIIVCVDQDSTATGASLVAARNLRAIGPGRLTLVHALVPPFVYPALPGSGVQTWIPNPQETRAAATIWLEGMAEPGETIAVLEGYAPEAVCGWAVESGADLIVAAAHRGRIERILLGGFASFLAHNAPCQVLLIRPIPSPVADSVPRLAQVQIAPSSVVPG